MSKLIDEVKKNLPSENDFEPVLTPVQEVLDLFNGIDMTHAPVTGLCGSFSGCDVIAFFGDEVPHATKITIGKYDMEAEFILGPTSSAVALSNEWIDFNMIGLNEIGQGGMIIGKCKPIDFEIKTGIGVLSMGIKVFFESTVSDIKGWVDGSYNDNVAVRAKLNELYRAMLKKKGINHGQSEV